MVFRGTVRRLEQRAWGLHHAHSPLRHGLKNEKNRRTGLAMSASTIFSMAKGGNIDASLGAYRQHFRRDLEPHRVEEWLEELAAFGLRPAFLYILRKRPARQARDPSHIE